MQQIKTEKAMKYGCTRAFFTTLQEHFQMRVATEKGRGYGVKFTLL